MKTPEILIPALRQYASNTKEGDLFAGFDYEKVVDIVTAIQDELEELLDSTPDFIKVGNGTLHGAIDHWQNKYEELNKSLPKIKADAIRGFKEHYEQNPYIDSKWVVPAIKEYADKIERGEV